MNAARASILGLFVLVLLAPFFAQRMAGRSGQSGEAPPAGMKVETLVVVTPHIEQIRLEFAAGFDRWHRREFGTAVKIDWRTPGGTTEILKLLDAMYARPMLDRVEALRAANPEAVLDPKLDVDGGFPAGAVAFDVMFGGGSFDHGRLKELGRTRAFVPLLVGGKVEEVEIRQPRERLTAARLERLKAVETDVVVRGKAVPLRFAIEAVEGGRETLAGLLPAEGGKGAPASVKARLDLGRAERMVTVRRSVPAGFKIDEVVGWYGLDKAPKRTVGELIDRVGGEDARARTRVEAELRAAFGKEIALTTAVADLSIGAGWLFDPEQYWLGPALSGFGIVYNRPLLAARKLPEPRAFSDLAAPAYWGLLAMADPRQSGSVATLYDAILNNAAARAVDALPAGLRDARRAGKALSKEDEAAYQRAVAVGFEGGFALLRDLSGNARYFSAASTQPPTDVSQGDALAGVAIDFYGRGQAQAVLRPGQRPEDGRVGYTDPADSVYIDSDPVSILRGAPNPELARRFVQYTLTPEGQALWQFLPLRDGGAGRAATGTLSAVAANPRRPGAPADERPMGPDQHRLRRMPVLRAMYAEPWRTFLADRTNPYELASPATVRGWRDGMIVMMGCFGIDAADECREAYRVLCAARESVFLGDGRVSAGTLAEMEGAFYAMPVHRMADGRELVFSAANYGAISEDTDRWRDPVRGPEARIGYTAFFRATYERVIELGRAVR